MGKIVAEISVSLDGYVAGPNPTLENPLGEGGDQLHEWVFPLKSWREPHGLPGGETGPDDELITRWSSRNNGASPSDSGSIPNGKLGPAIATSVRPTRRCAAATLTG